MKTVGSRLTSRPPMRLSVPPKVADPHYSTPEHRAWRAEVIRRSGGACADCQTAGKRLYADHVVELRDGGAPFNPANGAARCGACHTRKTAAARAARQRG